MKNIMLISVESVKENAYIHKNVLPDTVKTTIMRVQQTMLKRIMGDKVYNDFLDRVISSLPPSSPIVPLTPEDKELLEEYIQPFLVAAVDYKILVPLTIQARSKTTGKGTDTNFTPSDLSELFRLKDQMKQDVDEYADDLRKRLSNICAAKVRKTTPWQSIKFK